MPINSASIQNCIAGEYEVAFSFCRSDRHIARQVARCLRAVGITVYYDEWNENETVGRLLHDELRSIYFERSLHCVALVSHEYFQGQWPGIEWDAIAARAQEGGREFLTIVSLDGIRPSFDSESPIQCVLNERRPTVIARAVLEKIHASFAFNLLTKMRAACIVITIPIVFSALGVFLFNPSLWLVHLVFVALVGCVVVSIIQFFRAPLLISTLFMAVSAHLAISAYAAQGIPDLGKYVLQFLFASLAIALFVLGIISAWQIAKNRRRHEMPLRDHPLQFMREYPHLVVVGAERDPILTSLCRLLRAFRFHFHKCSVPIADAAVIEWPDRVKSSVLVLCSKALDDSLWNNKKRCDAFKQWLSTGDYYLLAATGDGALAPVIDRSIGYIDTKLTGVFRTVLFLTRAFGGRLQARHYERLKLFAKISTTLCLINLAVNVILTTSGKELVGFRASNLLASFMLTAFFAFVWTSVYTRPWLSNVVFGTIVSLLLYAGVTLFSTNTYLSIIYLVMSVYIGINLMVITRGNWVFHRAYRKALKA